MANTPLQDLLGADDPTPDSLDDDDFAPMLIHRRTSVLTVLLTAGVIAGIAFTGGVLVQKHHDKSLTASSATGLPAGFGGTGGLPSFGQGGPTGLGNGSSTTGQSDGPVVVGTILSASATTMVVQDLGGTKHTVTLGNGVTVTRASTTSQLHRGDTVSVNGTKSSNGDVSATAVTAR